VTGRDEERERRWMVRTAGIGSTLRKEWPGKKDPKWAPSTIIRLRGLPAYARCLRASLGRRPTTFLATVHTRRD
jgi:hypothetical protein